MMQNNVDQAEVILMGNGGEYDNEDATSGMA